MSIYRTRTYIAADFDNDRDAVDQLEKWNNNNDLALTFSNAHDLQCSRDTSLYCTIKKSLAYRMSGSKLFVLIVGDHTDTISKGGCQFCNSYNSYTQSCARRHHIDYRSYIKYECDLAIKAHLPIIVLYNDTQVHCEKCPKSVRYLGVHTQMVYYDYQSHQYYWDYQAVKDAFNAIQPFFDNL